MVLGTEIAVPSIANYSTAAPKPKEIATVPTVVVTITDSAATLPRAPCPGPPSLTRG